MRKFIIIIISLLVFVVGAALIAPFLIPLETYKKEAETRLSQMTGRDVRIDGEMRLKLLPDISIALGNVHVGNPEGFSSPYLAEIESLDVEVALKPLFDKRVQVERLVLVKPVVNLETNKAGTPNWLLEFNAPKTPAPTAKNGDAAGFSLIANAHAQGADAPAASQSFSINNVNLSGFSVENGSVTYMDANATLRVTDISLKADAVAVDKPLDVNGGFKWNDQEFKVAAKAESLSKLMEQQPSGVSVKMESKHVNANFNGTASPAGAKGKLDASSPSIVEAMRWLGKPMGWNKTALSFATTGDVNCTTTTCALSSATINVDQLRFTGNVSAVFAEKPTIKATLSTKSLNLTPYMDAPKQARGNLFISNAYAQAPWSNAPIDLSGLNAVNADVELAAEELIAPPWQLKNTRLHALVQGGAGTLTIRQAELLGGSVKGTLKAASGGSAAANVTASNVNIESLLKILGDNDKLKGNADVALNVNASGKSLANMINTLNGNGSIQIVNGAIKGVNLAQMARNVKSAFTAAPGTQQTDFSELGGTFAIKNGVISNNDLGMKSPYIRLSGAGNINLPAYTINYRLVPKLVDTSKGQRGSADRLGIEVPIIVSGALNNPQFTPDLQAIVTDALQNKEQLKENFDAIKSQFKDGKAGVKQDFKDIKNIVKDPAQLNNLGGLFGMPNATPQAQPTPAPTPIQPTPAPATESAPPAAEPQATPAPTPEPAAAAPAEEAAAQ